MGEPHDLPLECMASENGVCAHLCQLWKHLVKNKEIAGLLKMKKMMMMKKNVMTRKVGKSRVSGFSHEKL